MRARFLPFSLLFSPLGVFSFIGQFFSIIVHRSRLREVEGLNESIIICGIMFHDSSNSFGSTFQRKNVMNGTEREKRKYEKCCRNMMGYLFTSFKRGRKKKECAENHLTRGTMNCEYPEGVPMLCACPYRTAAKKMKNSSNHVFFFICLPDSHQFQLNRFD